MTPNEKVTNAVKMYCRAHKANFDKIFAELKYDYLNGNWYFFHSGMYLGIEENGYLHS